MCKSKTETQTGQDEAFAPPCPTVMMSRSLHMHKPRNKQKHNEQHGLTSSSRVRSRRQGSRRGQSRRCCFPNCHEYPFGRKETLGSVLHDAQRLRRKAGRSNQARRAERTPPSRRLTTKCEPCCTSTVPTAKGTLGCRSDAQSQHQDDDDKI
jgi:hypothetical protein